MGSLAIPHFDNIVAALDEERVTVLYPIAAFAWAWFDYILTFEDEVELIWMKQIRGSSWLFLWVRYYGLSSITFHIVAVLKNVRLSRDDPVVLLPRNMPLLASAELVSFVALWSVQIVLQLRLYAIYMSKRLALFNAVLYVLEVPAMLYIWLHVHPFHCKDQKNADSPLVQALRCGRGYQWYLVPGIIFDIWIGGLACYKFFQRVLRRGNTGNGTLFNQFIRDSVIHYFGYIVAILIFHVMGSFGHGDRHVSMFQTANFIVASRLLLHLRQSYYATSDDDEAAAEATLSAMRFQGRSAATARSRFVDPTFWGDDRPDDGQRIGSAPE